MLLTIALATAPTVALAAEQTVAPAAIESAAPEQDLLTIYRLARDADRRLSAAEQRRRGADAQVRQARSQFLPQISAHAGYEHERQSQDFGEIDEDLDTSGWDATLSLTQPIFRRGNFIDLERARTGQQGGDLEVLLNEQRLVIDVTEAYFNVLLAQDELALVEAEGAAVASQRRRAERALEVGTGTQTDVDEARAAYDRVRAQRVAALNQLDVARESLRRLTGHSPGTLAGLHEGFEPQPVEPGEPEHWVELAGRHNLEVRLAELEDQLARHDVSARRAERWPEVDLEARYTHFSGERDQQQFRDGSPVVETLDGTTDTRSIRLQLSVPLFTGGGISSRIRAAEAERTATADELYDQRRASALDARSAFLGLTSERERVRALEQALVSARSNEASVRRGQEVGTRTTTDLLNAQSRRFETKRDLQAARYDYLLHFVRLHAAAGLAVDQALIAEINAQLQGID
ncbi:TolC family outer membrane protein [Halorhodospira abdelmalekii]|uniref:TolC family outer membrane protein n=1 Tax=Halorhodospira abdelmalekii TaxID=421629 RepID=UPI0019061EA9